MATPRLSALSPPPPLSGATQALEGIAAPPPLQLEDALPPAAAVGAAPVDGAARLGGEGGGLSLSLCASALSAAGGGAQAASLQQSLAIFQAHRVRARVALCVHACSESNCVAFVRLCALQVSYEQLCADPALVYSPQLVFRVHDKCVHTAVSVRQ